MSTKLKEISVIGAGIVGLATAYKLQKANPGISVRIFEKEEKEAKHQTGNNSGVLHAGLYYVPNSFKARLCVSGLSQMLSFARENQIPMDQCGKIVVATSDDELKALETLYDRAIKNGIMGARYISKEEIKEFEPHAAGIKGLHIPVTGIIDYKAVCKKLRENITQNGGQFQFDTRIRFLKPESGKWILGTNKGEFKTDFFINCGGLYSDKIYQMTTKDPTIKIIPFRGEYYTLKSSKSHLVKNLIYPVPDARFPFLGVHFTRMIGGGVECGPNAVLAAGREAYSKTKISPLEFAETLMFPGFWKFSSKYWRPGFDEMKRSFSKKLFCKSLQRLIPEVREDDLEPGGAGVRAQVMDNKGNLIQDFTFKSVQNGLHVLNTPSPAATASLAIADEIVSQVKNF